VKLTQEEASAAMTICSIVAKFGRALELEKDGRLAEGRAIREQIEDTLRAEDLRLIARRGARSARDLGQRRRGPGNARPVARHDVRRRAREPVKIPSGGVLVPPEVCVEVGL
jgi:hypothetical protein